MASPFSVTATANSIALDRERRGEASFTVFNATGRATRARVRVVPERPEAGPWLTLDGEAERKLAIGGTDQVVVRVRPPAGAVAGSYPFRLEVIGVDAPDTEFTTGPTVTFEVPPAPKPKKPVRWQLPVAALALVAVGVAAYLLLQRPGLVDLPPVRELSEAEARSRLEGACTPMPCFDVTVRPQVDNQVAESLAIATEPEGRARRGSAVTLVVSSGRAQVAVPRVAGMTREDGVSAILLAGLGLDGNSIACYHGSIRNDLLVGTEPGEGVLKREGDAVKLYRSSGPRPSTSGATPSTSDRAATSMSVTTPAGALVAAPVTGIAAATATTATMSATATTAALAAVGAQRVIDFDSIARDATSIVADGRFAELLDRDIRWHLIGDCPSNL